MSETTRPNVAVSVPTATETLAEYYREYDRLDDQGQMSPEEIHGALARRYFKGAVSPKEGLDALTRAARAEQPKEVRAVTERVADAASKLVEPAQASLFDAAPIQAEASNRNVVKTGTNPPVSPTQVSDVRNDSPSRMLEPKNEGERNYEDFEAVFAVAKQRVSNGQRSPAKIVFETVTDGVSVRYEIPWMIAASLMNATNRYSRMVTLQRVLHPGRHFE